MLLGMQLGSGDMQRLGCVEVVACGSVGGGREAEEIKPSLLPSFACGCVSFSEAPTAVWRCSLFLLNAKCASLCVLPAMCCAHG